ncbi:helix-turn-helix transcriptional regulator [Panacibacter ginsenosidivorans]|uniref:Helix-turn-helix transcriptional regulator n=1 Tax=Panacibacter ginsenosidivorans TaxID=1813871 RepID=A0A5B8VCR2_9BACT|nr:helix-turn-helix transcriptional regulator [Panacibacter ginsenosidivorans]QEC69317.1 helix-turn-helix transcriptional regulator [Panacibacter ginsenosidivorans]
MNAKKKEDIRKLFGMYLKKRREEYLKINSVRQLSFNSNIDQSKLSKIEKGQIDFRFDTLMEIAITYKLKPKQLFDFDISFWKEEE